MLSIRATAVALRLLGAFLTVSASVAPRSTLVKREDPRFSHCQGLESWLGRFCHEQQPEVYVDLCWRERFPEMPLHDAARRSWPAFADYFGWGTPGIFDTINRDFLLYAPGITPDRIPDNVGHYVLRSFPCVAIDPDIRCQHKFLIREGCEARVSARAGRSLMRKPDD